MLHGVMVEKLSPVGVKKNYPVPKTILNLCAWPQSEHQINLSTLRKDRSLATVAKKNPSSSGKGRECSGGEV